MMVKESESATEIAFALIEPPEMCDVGQVARVKASIARHGMILPLLVSKHDDKYVVVDGVARYWALNESQPQTVPVVFVNASFCDDIVALRQLNKFKFSFK